MAIQTIKATIQMRYGSEEELDSDQLVTGEWAVSTDTRYVRMCFAPGIVLRMATYEAFEQDMLEIQTILATCQDIQVAVEQFEQLAEQHKNDASSSALLSESWAHGDTGVREGEDTDNSKYWSDQSKSEADRAKEEADRASSIVGYDIDAKLNETSTNPVQNKVITEELNKKLNTDGDASNVLANFEQAEERINVVSGENLSSFAGKVKKFFFDLKSAAFCDVVQSVNITEPGFVMDGKTASDAFTELNKKLEWEYIGSARSNTDISLPAEWHELKILLENKNNSAFIELTPIREMLSKSQIIYFRSGFLYEYTGYMFTVSVGRTYVQITNAFSTDIRTGAPTAIIDSTYIYVWYR